MTEPRKFGKWNKIHLRAKMEGIPQDFAVCNEAKAGPLTEDPTKITCKSCKRTQKYRDI